MNVEELFTSMVERRASHLHLVPGSPILMRINNQLVSMDGPTLSTADTEAFSRAIMNDDLQDEFEERLECNFAFSVPGLSRFRVNVYRQRGSVACVVSTNPPSAPTLENLKICLTSISPVTFSSYSGSSIPLIACSNSSSIL